MTHGSLFSGIGGFDLAAEWMGWENKFQCEWNEFAQKILKYYWPEAEIFVDITKTDFTTYANRIDILTGGFPCQPFSTAGNQKGTEDNRYLWPEMLRAIREIQPTWVVGENVRGIVTWNEGLVFDKVQTDLEIEGYEVTPFLLPACGINADHLRYRTWFVAHSDRFRCHKLDLFSKQSRRAETISTSEIRSTINRKELVLSNSERIGQSRSGGAFKSSGPAEAENWEASWSNINGGWPTQPMLCNGVNGLSGKLDGIAFSDWCKGSLEGAGNAIVPQLALQIFKAIHEYNNLQSQ